jgi:LysM repeat protein/ABC-type branched-subunit amino acid transport system substrate-binding protein
MPDSNFLKIFITMRFHLFTLLLLVFTFTITQHALAQDVIVKRSTIIESYKGKPNYIHFVKKGETLNAIAKAYNVSIEEIIAENPLINQGMKVDMVLRIPQKYAVAIPEDVAPKAETRNEQVKAVEKPKEQVKPVEDQDFIIYQVKKQETLYGISRMYNITIDDIRNANPGLEVLQEGMEIKIPKKKPEDKISTHEVSTVIGNNTQNSLGEIIVKTGETLYSISKAYNTTVDNLIELNPQLSEGLKAGMVLKLRNIDSLNISKPLFKNEPAVVINPVVPAYCYNPDNIKTTFKIALLLPFLLGDADAALEAPEQENPSDFENFDYFQFYAGFMLAADSLEKYGLHARIQVMDGDKLNDTLTIRQTLRKPGMDKMDLIVGPMYANSFSVAARFAKKNEIEIINPLSRRENIVSRNPFVVKAQVSDSATATKLSSFIRSRYPNANIIVIRNDNKELKSVADEFEAQIKISLANHSFKGNLQAATYSTGMMPAVSKKLKTNVKNIVIFFSNNKTNVPNFVSLLNPLSNSNDIILFGMDGWDELELETEFLVNLNYHQLTSNYIDYESDAVKQFVTQFRNKYGAVPLSAKHAFLGYDIGWYFLTSLMWYGEKDISCLPYQKGKGLQYNFDFSTASPGDGLQNHDIVIVKLQDYKMIKVE